MGSHARHGRDTHRGGHGGHCGHVDHAVGVGVSGSRGRRLGRVELAIILQILLGSEGGLAVLLGFVDPTMSEKWKISNGKNRGKTSPRLRRQVWCKLTVQDCRIVRRLCCSRGRGMGVLGYESSRA